MNISVSDELYERYQRLQERVNASRVCAEALERELDVLEGLNEGELAVSQMVERLMDASERSYTWGYADGRAWGLQNATRDDLETAHELKDYSGRSMLTDAYPNPEAGRSFETPDWIYPDGVPEADIPGLDGNYRRGAALAKLGKHVERAHEEDVEAYAEGWRDALNDLYKVLHKATTQRNQRSRVPQAFRKTLDNE